MDNTDTVAKDVPSALRPGAGSCYGFAWDRLWKYFVELLLIIAVMIVAAVPLTWMSIADEVGAYEGFLLKFFALIYWIMLYAPLRYGLCYSFLRAVRGEKLETNALLAPFRNYFNAVLAHLLVSIVIGIGLVFFIVPGIIFACKLAFVPYLVIDRKLDAVEAFKESWRMTGGHAVDIFLIGFLAIPIYIAGMILLGVGMIISAMWVGLACASMYHAVTGMNESAA